MSRYQDLCDAFARFESNKLEFFRRMGEQAYLFKNGLAEYIGAPDGYIPKISDAHASREYVRLLKGDIDDWEDIDSPADLYKTKNDLIIWFGVAISLQRGPNTFPLQHFQIKVGLREIGDRMEVLLTELDTSFECERVGNAYAYEAAYEAICNRIEDRLNFEKLGSR
ncbi:hypothetical protein [Paraburkholderia sp. RL17-373-BIF-A]|uniref:hypothetical protein n=1 Tax=Paraburkholderia sp. RL17-373-BIF-A TaxID=3031629 RepID=UPI0038BC29F2